MHTASLRKDELLVNGASPMARLALLHWHLDRYDRLRASVAMRASVVLSAAALLSAGNAVILTQVVGSNGSSYKWVRILVATLSASDIGLLVSCVVVASAALVSLKRQKDIFKEDKLVPAPIYSASDSIAKFASFWEFERHLRTVNKRETILAASTELWICIGQHRRRYRRLRHAVWLMCYAAGVFLTAIVAFLAFCLVSGNNSAGSSTVCIGWCSGQVAR